MTIPDLCGRCGAVIWTRQVHTKHGYAVEAYCAGGHSTVINLVELFSFTSEPSLIDDEATAERREAQKVGGRKGGNAPKRRAGAMLRERIQADVAAQKAGVA